MVERLVSRTTSKFKPLVLTPLMAEERGGRERGREGGRERDGEEEGWVGGWKKRVEGERETHLHSIKYKDDL